MELDFSAANLKWLADITPLEHQVEPRVQTTGALAGRNELFRPRFGLGSGSRSQQDLYFGAPVMLPFARQPASSISRQVFVVPVKVMLDRASNW